MDVDCIRYVTIKNNKKFTVTFDFIYLSEVNHNILVIFITGIK
jgi:hypothetical protein